MEINIKGDAEEIAALVLAVQERQRVDTPQNGIAAAVIENLNERAKEKDGKTLII